MPCSVVIFSVLTFASMTHPIGSRVTAMDAQSPFPPTFPRRTIFAGS
jgi:hypothetical protein